MGLGGFGGSNNIRAGGIGSSVGDVFGDGSEEEEGFLEDDADVLAVLGDGEGANIVSVDDDGAFLGIVEAADEIDEGAFACAAGADESDHFAGLDFEIDVVEDFSGTVAEGEITDVDFAANASGVDGFDGFTDAGDAIENFENSVGGRGGALGGGQHAAHRIEACVESSDVGDEDGEHADGDGMLCDGPGAEGPDDEYAEVGEEGDDGDEGGPELVDFVVGFEHVLVSKGEAVDFPMFLGKSFDDADPGDGIGQDVDHFAPGGVSAGETVSEAGADAVDEPGDNGEGDEGDGGHGWIDQDEDN